MQLKNSILNFNFEKLKNILFEFWILNFFEIEILNWKMLKLSFVERIKSSDFLNLTNLKDVSSIDLGIVVENYITKNFDMSNENDIYMKLF